MYNFCTLFDSYYLTRGLAMYESLLDSIKDEEFTLYVFAFDDISLSILTKLYLKNMIVISLNVFEDETLIAIKPTRSVGEYCWTCTPSVIKYAIETYNLDSCTYLDADLYFFSNPCQLVDEIKDKSVLISEHRYTPEYDQSETSGIYCVQFMTFKNNKLGLEVLEWWRLACNEWCFDKQEDGKFGDQKYLDDWLSRFDGIHVLENIGGGVAPWNVQQYDVQDSQFEVIFYHFHNFKYLSNIKIDLGDYKLKERDITTLYKPYIRHIENIKNTLKKRYEFDSGITVTKNSIKEYLKIMKRKLKGSYNIYSKEELLR